MAVPNFNLVFPILLISFRWSDAAEAPKDDDSGENLALVAVGLGCAGILLVAICSWTWFRRQYRKLCPQPPPPDEPEIFVWGSQRSQVSTGSIMTLNSGNLAAHNSAFDPHRPTFELLPTPETLHRDKSVILANEDVDLSASDWFENHALKFPRQNLHFLRDVGSGWFGLVIVAEATPFVQASTHLAPPSPAHKVMVKHLRDDASTREQMLFLDEARLHRDGSHRNILKLLGFSIEKFPYLLIYEHFPRGDLKAFLLERSKGLSLLDRSGASIRNKMLLNIAQALAWMHEHGFTHPDLATRNCLVGANDEIIVGDYGLAQDKYRQEYFWVQEIPIPIRWAAPESLHCSPTTIKVFKATPEANIWTFGVVLWEICELGKFPYSDLLDEHVLQRVILDKNHNLQMPSITSLPYVSLRNKMGSIMTSCFHPLPPQRLPMAKLVELLSLPI